MWETKFLSWVLKKISKFSIFVFDFIQERVSVSQQLMQVYGLNMRVPKPCQLYLTSIKPNAEKCEIFKRICQNVALKLEDSPTWEKETKQQNLFRIIAILCYFLLFVCLLWKILKKFGL